MTHIIKKPNPRTHMLQVVSRRAYLVVMVVEVTPLLVSAVVGGGRWRGPWRGWGSGSHSSGAGHGHPGRQGAVVSGNVNPWRGEVPGSRCRLAACSSCSTWLPPLL